MPPPLSYPVASIYSELKSRAIGMILFVLGAYAAATAFVWGCMAWVRGLFPTYFIYYSYDFFNSSEFSILPLLLTSFLNYI